MLESNDKVELAAKLCKRHETKKVCVCVCQREWQNGRERVKEMLFSFPARRSCKNCSHLTRHFINT